MGSCSLAVEVIRKFYKKKLDDTEMQYGKYLNKLQENIPSSCLHINI